MVLEFINVFPTNLPGLPPKSDIDLEIDLELGTKPISVLPFQMALVEL